MIELKQVTKQFGSVTAVKDLSFTCPKGQIIGLLGQNGAGKTTTLNMLTGYDSPTSGQVLVDGMDMLTHPRECKRLIGYLPEKPPLYDEMTVKEFLRFVCELKDVSRRSVKAHIDDILSLCGLTDVCGRVLGNLSKGYRQRAGLAQALCGDPSILILDEPTVGLDPKQVVQIRQLMRLLGESHTILFSSHLLNEVQQLCSRVIILHQGKLIREQDVLSAAANDVVHLRISVMMNEKKLVPALKSLPCIRRLKTLPSMDTDISELELECTAGDQGHGDPQTQLFRLLCGLDAPIRMLVPHQDSLEEAFLRITGSEGVET